MKIKYLIMVSLMLAVLTIGAVSASEDISSDDDLAASEITEDAVGELPSDEIIAGEDAQDELGADEDVQDALELEASDFDVNVTEEINLDVEDSWRMNVVSFYCPEGSDGGQIKIHMDYDRFITISPEMIGTVYNVKEHQLSINRGENPISVYFVNGSDTMLLANTTIKVNKTLTPDEFYYYTNYESSKSNYIFTINHSPVQGNFTVYVDGNQRYSKKYDYYHYVYPADLNITEPGQYEILINFESESGDVVKLVEVNYTFLPAYYSYSDEILLYGNIMRLSDFIGNGTLEVYVDGSKRYCENVTNETGLEFNTGDLNITAPGNYDILAKFKLNTGEEMELFKFNLKTKMAELYYYESTYLSYNVCSFYSFAASGTLVVYVDGNQRYSKNVTTNDYFYISAADLNITSAGEYGILITLKTNGSEFEVIKFNTTVKVLYCDYIENCNSEGYVIYLSDFQQNGTVRIYVDGNESYARHVAVGEGTIYIYLADLNITSAGKYDIAVTFKPDEGNLVEIANYEMNVCISDDIIWICPSLELEAKDVFIDLEDFGDNRINGTVVVYIDGNVVFNKSVNKKGSFELSSSNLHLSGYEYGDYKVTVTYMKNGTEKHVCERIVEFIPALEIYSPRYFVAGQKEAIYIYAPRGLNGNFTMTKEVITGYDKWDNPIYGAVPIVSGKIVDGFARIPVDNLTEGIYEYDLDYDIANIHDGYKSIGLNVRNNTPGYTSTVSSQNITEGEDVLVTLTGPTYGKNVVVYIDGLRAFSYPFNLGEMMYCAENLTVGDHYITLKYRNDDEGISYSTTYQVTVNVKPEPVDSNLAIGAIGDVVAGDNVTVVITADEKFTGSVNVQVGSVNTTANIINGKGNVTVSTVDFALGETAVKVTSASSDLFIAGSAEAKFNVTAKPVDPNLAIGAIGDVALGSDVTVVITADEKFTGSVNVQVGSVNTTANIINGKGNVTVSTVDFALGETAVKVTSASSDLFIAGSAEAKFNVTAKPVDPNLAIGAIGDVALGSDVTVVITADEKFTGSVNVQVGSVNTTANIINGKGNVTVSTVDFALGETAVKVTSASSDLFIAGSAEAKFNVTAKKEENVTPVVYPAKIDAKDLSAYYNKDSYSVTVYGTDGNVAAGVEVIFKVNGKKIGSAKTNAKGVATIKLKQLPKTYKITSEALGETVTKKLTVKQVLKLKKVKVKKSAKKLAITATLKEGKKAIKGKKITFKFNGKKYTAKTNKKGVAKITVKKSVLKKLKVGKKVKYQATYIKDTVKKSVKVKK